jgi:hypothetical protein
MVVQEGNNGWGPEAVLKDWEKGQSLGQEEAIHDKIHSHPPSSLA